LISSLFWVWMSAALQTETLNQNIQLHHCQASWKMWKRRRNFRIYRSYRSYKRRLQKLKELRTHKSDPREMSQRWLKREVAIKKKLLSMACMGDLFQYCMRTIYDTQLLIMLVSHLPKMGIMIKRGFSWGGSVHSQFRARTLNVNLEC
jgi:hypothetical protein